MHDINVDKGSSRSCEGTSLSCDGLMSVSAYIVKKFIRIVPKELLEQSLPCICHQVYNSRATGLLNFVLMNKAHIFRPGPSYVSYLVYKHSYDCVQHVNATTLWSAVTS